MNPLLAILNPRYIEECIEAFSELDIDKAWLTGYTERELCAVFPELLTKRYTHIVVVSDDCIVTQPALDAVLHHLPDHPVVTGYCNLDETDERVNLSKRILLTEEPQANSYDFYTTEDLEHQPDLIPTFFAGFSLTAMSKEMWQRFPFGCFHLGGKDGWASDYHLSRRLQEAGIPIFAPKAARVEHLKKKWNEPDHSRPLLVGNLVARIAYQPRLDSVREAMGKAAVA